MYQQQRFQGTPAERAASQDQDHGERLERLALPPEMIPAASLAEGPVTTSIGSVVLTLERDGYGIAATALAPDGRTTRMWGWIATSGHLLLWPELELDLPAGDAPAHDTPVAA